MKTLPKLVAHRGEMQDYPENTVPALQASINAGACFVEFDIQFSKDVVPMVFHDPELKRTTGVGGRIMELDSTELKTICADRLPNLKQPYPDALIPTLADTVDLFNQTPRVTAFVELKRHSIEHYDTELCVDLIYQTMRLAKFPWVLISFNDDAIVYAKQKYKTPIAWILREHTPATKQRAQEIAPDYIFCNVKRLPKKGDIFWQDPHQHPYRWVIYDIMESAQALELHAQGADFIETGCITKMLNTPPFSPTEC